MHSPIAFLTDLALVLGIAAVTSVLSQRLRLPPVFGYLVAGVIIGPNDLVPLVADIETVRTLSELGVILLMFSLGLGFTFRKIARLATTAGLIAAFEVALCLSLGYGAGQLLGWTSLESLFAGAMVAISSTMIIAKVFEEQSIKGPLADVVFGVLVMEDLLAILALAVLTAVSSGAGSAAASVADTLPRLVLFLAAVILVGLLIVPRFFRRVVRLRSDETTLVASVGLCFTLALLAQFAGYSVALGAFLSGAFIAEGGASRQVGPLIRPLRDMFAAIFFVAVGMSIQPSAIFTLWPAVLVLAAVVMVGKTVGVTMGTFMAGLGTRTAVRAGLSMGQIGEFSFIIAGLGVASGVTGGFLAPVAVYVSVLTSLMTPVLVSRSGAVANTVDRRLPRALQTYATLYGSWIESVRSAKPAGTPAFQVRRLARFIALDAILLTTLLVGTALAMERDLARLAAWSGLSTTAVRGAGLALALAMLFPLLYGIVRAARALGDAIAHVAVPPAAPSAVDLGLAPRRALRITVQIGIVLIVGMPMVAVTLPFLPGYGGPAFLAALLLLLGIAFWRSARNLQGHVQAGALMIVEALGAGTGRRAPGSAMLDEVRRVLPGIGKLTEVTVGPGFAAAGRTLSELNLRGVTGASVVGLRRGDQRIVLPSAREQLRSGDILAVTGNQRAVAAAAALLQGDESVALHKYHDATER